MLGGTSSRTMNRSEAQWTFCVVALVAVVLCLGGCAQPEDVASSEKDVVTLTATNFQQEVLSSPQLVLLDFGAKWCGPCKALAPIVAEVATEYLGKVKVGKIDVDAEPALANKYNVVAYPTLIILKEGKQVDQIVGLISKKELQEKLSRYVQNNVAETEKPKR
jgi:thioredoxin 1